MNSRRLALFIGWLIFTAALPLRAATFDWPRWRGPDLNGLSKETGWSATWPASGPKQLWKASVGTGFSSFAVANGRAYTMGNRKGKETVYCFDAATGAEVWKHTYDCDLDPREYEGGPSATPTVDGKTVFTLSRKGHLFCFEAATGRMVWQANVNDLLGLKTYRKETPEWGYAGSPLVQAGQLILNVGTCGAAFDKTDGKLLWSTGRQASGYATPVPFKAGKGIGLVVFAARTVTAISSKDGATLWEYPWKTDHDINAADPIVMGNKVFISSGEGHGNALLQFNGGQVSKIWENQNLRTHLNGCVLLAGHLYGFDGDVGHKSSSLRCVEFETGKLRWSEPIRPGALMAAAGKLIVLSEDSELIVAPASAESFRPMARAQVMGGKCWTTPILSNGRIYCRNSKGDVVCVDVSAKSTTAAGRN